MEGKDFAKSKRRTTQRHTPRRGGGTAGSKQENSVSRLDTNQDRYEEPDASASGEPVPRSQGADLGMLLSADYTEFRQRGSLIEEVEALPTPSGADTAVLDLNINMQSLAASLSNLPIDTVLGIDPCYCSDFAAAAPAVDTGMQRHNDTCTAATMSTPDIQGHGKAGTLRVAKLDNHHAALQTPGTASKQAADHTQKHTAGTANDGLDQHSSLESNSEQGYAADQQPATTKKQQHHDLSGTERPVATSTSGYTAGSDKFASNGKTENDSRLQTKPEATQVQQTLAHKTSAHDSAKAVAQATPVAKPGLETHDDELDKMLNSHNLDAVKSTSTVVQHLDKQEQGSLEDWLDSL